MSKSKKPGPLSSDEELRKRQEEAIVNRMNEVKSDHETKEAALNKKRRGILPPKVYSFPISRNVTEENTKLFKDLISRLAIEDIKKLVELLEQDEIKVDKNTTPTIEANIHFVIQVSQDEYFILLSKLYLLFLNNIKKAQKLHEAILTYKASEEQQRIYVKHWEGIRLLMSCLLNYKQIESDRKKKCNKHTGKAETLITAKNIVKNLRENIEKDMNVLAETFKHNPFFNRASLEANQILGIERMPILNLYPLLENYCFYLKTIKHSLSKESPLEAHNEKPLAEASVYAIQRIYNNIALTDLEYTIYNDYLNTETGIDNAQVELNKLIDLFYKEVWVPISIAPSMFKHLKSKSKTKSGK